MDRRQKRLLELLKEAENIEKDDINAQKTWAAETQRLIDFLLGPGPNNFHTDAYLDFEFAKTHFEKVAILKAILFNLEPTHFKNETSSPLEGDVFLVHGHDIAIKESVARFLENISLKVVILNELPSLNMTIIEKIEKFSNVHFAVILLTPDDIGGNNSNNLLQRARQNVILELGYFMGKLGRDKVCALYKEGVELPSDYHGIIYILLDNANGWKLQLAKELKASGLKINSDSLI